MLPGELRAEHAQTAARLNCLWLAYKMCALQNVCLCVCDRSLADCRDEEAEERQEQSRLARLIAARQQMGFSGRASTCCGVLGCSCGPARRAGLGGKLAARLQVSAGV